MRSPTFHFAVWTLLLASSTQAYEQGKTRVAGTMEDQAEQAIPGATINLISLDRVLQTKSLANGSFQFNNVPAGSYQFEATAPGFRKQKRSLELLDSIDTPLSIVLRVGSMPDTETCGSHAVLTYWPPRSVKTRLIGMLRDFSSQRSIVNAIVTVTRGIDHDSTFEVKSDRTGTFQFKNLPAGYYDFRISKQGYPILEVKQFIIPREKTTSIDAVMLRQNQVIACQ